MGNRGPNVKMVIAGDDDDNWPDGIGTHWAPGPDLEGHLAALSADEPLVITQRAGTAIDLEAYAGTVKAVEAAGHDLVIRVVLE